MGKNKIKKFRENETFGCMVQPLFEEVFSQDYKLKGYWRRDFFRNENPIVLELGCGRGDYTIGLARMYPEKNFIGVDVKGARMWRGGRTATDERMKNVGFLRTRIEFINSLFAEGEVDEVWITFPDPQLKRNRIKKRLTAPLFLARYARFLKEGGVIHLKTDSSHLHYYTKSVIEANRLSEYIACDDIYARPQGLPEEVLALQTTYEKRFLSEGKAITYLQFGLNGVEEFVEPVFEPDEHMAE
ncbi:MAG TPA: tRNA (guanosine(46)-N7)-methyltransferase TrmB [Candidatus Avirikenella pullistercoris]|nr:tRNA (guanosine(46)-N7)-methyltransferase TrmB [Candidatus Avirikenella pullistercoris]